MHKTYIKQEIDWNYVFFANSIAKIYCT